MKPILISVAAATAAALAAPAGAVTYNYTAELAIQPSMIDAAGNYIAHLPDASFTLQPMDQVVGTIRFANNGRLTIVDNPAKTNEQDITATFGGGLSSFFWTITGVEGEYLRPTYQEGSCSDLCFTTFGELTKSFFSFTGADFRLLYRGNGPVTFDPGAFYAKTARISAPGAAIPEPATWAMMIGGFALAGAAARRRPAVRPATA